MTKVTDKFSNLSSNTEDPRTRRYLTPKRVVKTWGSVSGADNLLIGKPNQISFGADGLCTLQNGANGEHAAVLVDFGIEFPGSTRLMVFGVKGNGDRVDIIVRTGESAEEAVTPLGVNNTTNDHAIRDRVMNVGMYSACETNETGYRFLYVELLGEDTVIHIKALQGVFTYRDLEYKGSFECSDERLNEIWNTAAYTAHVNMQEYLWDGIKRDRLVWIGDMHTEVNTILTVFGYNDIIPKSLDLVRDDTPIGNWMNGISSYSIWWLLIHSDLYRALGNKAYLEEQKDYMTRLLSLLADCIDENGEEKLPEYRLLDWPNSTNPEAIHAGFQGLLKLAMDRGAELLDVLGVKDVADKCRATSKKMDNVAPDCNGSKQAAAFLALSGLGDASKLNESVIAPGGGHGYSTFFGYYVLAAKALAGDYAGALDDIKEYWGGMLDMGATTFWEDFDLNWLENAAPITDLVPDGKVDIHGAYGNYCYVKFRHSLCHGWASGPCPYLTNYVLGIRCIAPCKYEIDPQLAYLDYAKGTYPTPKGILTVSCRKNENGDVEVELVVPDGIEIVRK